MPTGTFYAQGVKANVLFCGKRPGSETPWTKAVWIYDLRTNERFTLKTKTLARADLNDFVACFNPSIRQTGTSVRRCGESNPEGRWRRYSYDELVARAKASLDIFWVRDESLADSSNLPDPDVIAADIIEELRAALDEFEQLRAGLVSAEGGLTPS